MPLREQVERLRGELSRAATQLQRAREREARWKQRALENVWRGSACCEVCCSRNDAGKLVLVSKPSRCGSVKDSTLCIPHPGHKRL